MGVTFDESAEMPTPGPINADEHLDPSALGPPVILPTCTKQGCNNIATEIYGARAKTFNRCAEHGAKVPPPFEPPSAPPFVSSARKGTLEQKLGASIALVGTVVYALDQFDGMLILERAEPLAHALEQVAAQNPKVKRALEAAMDGTAWGSVAIIVVPMAIAMLAHHEVIPEQYASFAGIGI